jgi:predicted transcriptional regulator
MDEEKEGTWAQGDCVWIEGKTGAFACDEYRRKMTAAEIAVSTHHPDALRVRELRGRLREAETSCATLRDGLLRVASPKDDGGGRAEALLAEAEEPARRFLDRLAAAERREKEAVAESAALREMLSEAAWALRWITDYPPFNAKASPANRAVASKLARGALSTVTEGLERADRGNLGRRFLEGHTAMLEALEEIEGYEDLSGGEDGHEYAHAVLVEIPEIARLALRKATEFEPQQTPGEEPAI